MHRYLIPASLPKWAERRSSTVIDGPRCLIPKMPEMDPFSSTPMSTIINYTWSDDLTHAHSTKSGKSHYLVELETQSILARQSWKHPFLLSCLSYPTQEKLITMDSHADNVRTNAGISFPHSTPSRSGIGLVNLSQYIQCLCLSRETSRGFCSVSPKRRILPSSL